MNKFLILFITVVGFCLPGLIRPASASGEGIAQALPPSLVTPEILEAKIAEVEAATDLTDEVKSKLIELHRKALTNLQTARSHAEAAMAFSRAAETAPALIESLREALDEPKAPPPLETLTADLSTPLRDIEQLLQKEQADLAAVDARRTDFERRLTYQENRPAAISQRLAEATLKQEEVVAEIENPAVGDEGPLLIQAGRWVLESRYVALSTEVKMLDQELLSQPLRVDLLDAKRDKEVGSVAWIRARVKALNELISSKRGLDAERTKTEAEMVRRETEGSDPLLIRLSERNAELAEEVNAMAEQLHALNREQEQAGKLAKRIAADYKDAQATLESSGLTEGLGGVLLGQRDSLPDIHPYRMKARSRQQYIAEIGVRWLRHQAEARRIADLDQTLVALEAEVKTEKTPQLRDKLRQLVEQRQILLDKALEADQFYLGQLRERDAAESELLGAAGAYDDFLIENMLWLRSADPTRLADLLDLPEEGRQLLNAAARAGPIAAFVDQVARTFVFWLALLIAAVLLWQRRALVAAIEETGKRVGRPTTDSIADSLRAFLLTLLVAAPLPLLLTVAGWQLQTAAQGTDLSHAIGSTLSRVALLLSVPLAFHSICIPRGLAAAHFLWPEYSLRLLRVELVRLTWVFVPALLVVRLAIDLNPAETGGTIARLAFLVGFSALTFFLYRVFHPKRGVLAYLRPGRERSLLFRTYRLSFALLLIFPPAVVMLALTGYIYSAAILSWMLLDTLWLVLGLVVLNALALRWLLVVRRRLAYEAKVEGRQAALATKQAGEAVAGADEGDASQFAEPEMDLAALSDDSRELIKIAVVFFGFVGLYLIWSSVLPALRIFEDVTLWYHTVTVEAEDKRLPITLADLGLALIYAIGVGILAKRLPALLEIILLRRSDLSSGSRYTVTTLTNYAIVAIGVVVVLNTIGTQWSQLQWLVAALGVGIGFGLQEIVANFISGLIILFERPIRVGDFVTVGETDGAVTKIRIRATTIRDRDGKELLVPNKEFITGRLLNWSLSDQTTRIIVSVGIAYGSNVRQAMELLEQAARENDSVLDDPAPSVIFESFGDNSLSLLLRCFVASVDLRYLTISALNGAVNDKFNAAGIVIAFPQRDLHLGTTRPLQVELRRGKEGPRDGGAGEVADS